MGYTPEETRAARASRKATITCDVRGCGKPIEGLSRLCHEHKDRRAATGDPIRKTIHGQTVNHYRDIVEPFLDFQYRVTKHPGIVNAVEALDQLLFEAQAKAPTELAPYIGEEAAARYRLSRLWMAGVSGYDLLKVFLAFHVLHQDKPHVFPDGTTGDYFRVQVAISVSQQAYRKGGLGRRPPGFRPPSSDGLRAKRLLHDLIDRRVGRLARRAATEVIQSQTEYRLRKLQVIGSEDEFLRPSSIVEVVKQSDNGTPSLTEEKEHNHDN